MNGNCKLIESCWKVYSLGSNSSGQLGTGENQDENTLVCCKFSIHSETNKLDSLSQNGFSVFEKIPVPSCMLNVANQKPPIVVGGGNHSLLYWKDLPLLYGCGSYQKNELLIGNTINSFAKGNENKTISLWTMINLPETNGNAELKNKNTIENLIQCDCIHSKMVGVKQISVGWNHTVLLSTTNRVYSTGDNSFGQCGIPLEDTQHKKQNGWIHINFDSVEGFEGAEISKVECGLRHTALLTKNGHVYTWGANSKGQLGLNVNLQEQVAKNRNKPGKNIFSPQKSNISSVFDVSCGRYHTACLTRSSDNQEKLFLNVSGKSHLLAHIQQIGNKNVSVLSPEWDSIDLSPFLVNTDSKPHIISSWDNIFVFGTSMKPSRNDKNTFEIIGFGSNSFNILGNYNIKGDEDVLPCFINPIEEEKCGNGNHKSKHEISSLACGSYHVVAKTTDGKVVCWGWNEHGNCGGDISRNVWPPQQLLTEHLNDCKVCSIGCGYGNTFIISTGHY
ncbi:hypothetical protein BB559_006016 [Furculomyces boomerangus]|uniref:RCC1-like domain-containing protein n=2 Tax=Harpellales TaxID=61421 RepID=A0A2T9Y582_9FUNG|nr:hypothetical protein BB559_006656 [Furculomyces boomerangus]PVU87496.1 hypothetical protein BB559_006016 [Furculomyces boomerangus]PWA00399.1 hypothetical protein BB558_003556 [Smittium angustum]